MGRKFITNLRFADDINALAGKEIELHNLIKSIENISRSYGMEINCTKTQLMTNSEGIFISKISINNTPLKVVYSFKYLGVIIDNKGSKAEILSITGQRIATLSNLNAIWYKTSIHLKAKIQLMQYLVH